MDEALKKQLEESLYIHYPLKADESSMLESRQLEKPVLRTRLLWDGERRDGWRTEGVGAFEIADGAVCLSTGTREPFWQANEKQDGTYATFGDFTAFLDVSGLALEGYSQLAFDILPECDGIHSPMLRVGYINGGVKKIPDEYSREGFNAISLKNHQWNQCVWDISELAHDRMLTVLFRIHKYGEDVSHGAGESGSHIRYTIRNIRMEKIETPNVTKGWQCEKGSMVWPVSGYWTHGGKTAILNPLGRCCETFSLIDHQSGQTVFTAPIEPVRNARGSFYTLDFSAFDRPGRYRLRAGEVESEPFPIGGHILESAVWKLINFLFCERCGYPVPGKHGGCHYDVLAHKDGKSLVFNGGWHDAADVSQQTTQSAEITGVLLEMTERAGDPALRARLMEEARWGLDFVLRTSFGGGYHAANVIMRRWTDNLIGNFDDVNSVYVHNNPFDGFLIAGMEAHAARVLQEDDPELAWKCLEAAREDYRCADGVFAANGIQRPARSEHTLNASHSQHYAAAALACARLYEATGEEPYRRAGVRWLERLLHCQDQGETGTGLSGFFYRDERKLAIVHFCHQSREHLFAQALAQGVRAFGQNARWLDALRAYGEYFKALRFYTEPYGMVPAGLYAMNELEDEETFRLLHPYLDFAAEKKNYREQLENGERLNDNYVIRSFPVWFSFRGNSAVAQSMAKSAALIGNVLGDGELLQMGREQAYWMLGKNPFGQCMIYGEGSRFSRLYTALLGETVGEMAVGVQTQGNEDTPYWPMGNIATYREVWVSAATHFLRLAAELY